MKIREYTKFDYRTIGSTSEMLCFVILKYRSQVFHWNDKDIRTMNFFFNWFKLISLVVHDQCFFCVLTDPTRAKITALQKEVKTRQRPITN
jgi:hypothetical protein